MKVDGTTDIKFAINAEAVSLYFVFTAATVGTAQVYITTPALATFNAAMVTLGLPHQTGLVHPPKDVIVTVNGISKIYTTSD